MSILVAGRDDVKSPLQSKPANEHAKLENDVIARCRNYCTPDPRHVIRRQNENCSIEIIEARYKISKNCARRRKYSLVPNSGFVISCKVIRDSVCYIETFRRTADEDSLLHTYAQLDAYALKPCQSITFDPKANSLPSSLPSIWNLPPKYLHLRP